MKDLASQIHITQLQTINGPQNTKTHDKHGNILHRQEKGFRGHSFPTKRYEMLRFQNELLRESIIFILDGMPHI